LRHCFVDHFHQMLHKLTALLLLIAVAGSTFNKAIILLDYSLNKNFIVTSLCENRNKPMSCCQGKCYLKKQLQKEDAGKNTSAPVKENIDCVWFCEENTTGYLSSSDENLLFQNYLLKQYSVLLSSVFHPPGKV